jgi:hypothetical protein
MRPARVSVQWLKLQYPYRLARTYPKSEVSIPSYIHDQGKTAVCRLDRTGSTLDGWRQRTINQPMTAAASGRGTAKFAGKLDDTRALIHFRHTKGSERR